MTPIVATQHDDNDPTGQLGRELAHAYRAAAVGVAGAVRIERQKERQDRQVHPTGARQRRR